MNTQNPDAPEPTTPVEADPSHSADPSTSSDPSGPEDTADAPRQSRAHRALQAMRDGVARVGAGVLVAAVLGLLVAGLGGFAIGHAVADDGDRSDQVSSGPDGTRDGDDDGRRGDHGPGGHGDHGDHGGGPDGARGPRG